MLLIFMPTIFGPFAPVFMALIAVSADDVMQSGRAVGTANNQVLLGCLVVVLIIVVIYFARKQDKQNAVLIARYDKNAEMMQQKHDALMERLDSEQKAFGEERRLRIEALMRIVSENALAGQAVASSVNAMREAVEASTDVSKELLMQMRKNGGSK